MTSRRGVLAATGATLGTAALAGCTSILGGGSNEGTPEPGAVREAPIPDSPDQQTYATMGTGESPVVTYFGNWKCPFCAHFSTGESDNPVLPLGTIVTDYVEPGDLSLRYRAFSYRENGSPFLGQDSPRAARAGLAVWNLDPQNYWAFHEQVMANQPPEDEQWATVDRLVSFAEEAGVGPTGKVRTALQEGTYEKPVRANTQAGMDAGIGGTPSVVVDGDPYSPFEPEKLRQALDSLTS